MRRGLTLVEVVVGIGLLATLLTGILVSAGKFSKQFRFARDKLDAVAILDEMTSNFVVAGYPKSDTMSDIPGKPGWLWKFQTAPAEFGPRFVNRSRLSIQCVRAGGIVDLAYLEIVHLASTAEQESRP